MRCVYCDGAGKRTREHVFPGFLLKAAERQGVFYSNAAKGYFDADAVVKDTCDTCNNIILSALDAYVSGLYKKYLVRTLVTSRTVRFDFERLLRWVLKVTYNAQRAFGGCPRNLTHLRQYMLGRSARPSSLILWGVVMKRSWVDGRWMNPRDYRSSDLRIPEIELGLEVNFCHMLVINSFCFIVADLVNADDANRDKLSTYLAHQLGAREVPPGAETFEFNASISKMDHVSHNVQQARQNPATFPDSREINVGGKRLMLTGLPQHYAIQRQRVRDSKHYLMTVDTQDGHHHAGIVMTELPATLKEFALDLRSDAIPLSKRCYAGVRRGQAKTYVTLFDPDEPGVPHLSTLTGTVQSDDNWRMFRDAIVANGSRLFIAESAFLNGGVTICNTVEVIAMQEDRAT
ncbi:hypothetical protein [Undibacterium sp. CY21W]|uniref:hypothetical protein n=1 Tax=Undibacterium sp. CY21W TaxID=2762293 RepID=UPI00164B3D3F|nr:hypothetical protein [Undibacterium sp. CY21W]